MMGLSLSLFTRGGGATATIGPSAVPQNIYMGVPTDTSISVTHRLANDTSGSRLVASTADDFSASPIYSARADSASSTVTHSLTGLTANTQYYLGLETNGTITPYSSGNTNLYTAGKTWTGRFTTAGVTPGTAESFRWGFGSCQSNVNNGTVLTGIRNNHPVKFFVHLGDLHYKWSFPVYPDPSITVLEAATDTVLQAQHSGKFFQYTPIAYIMDDHDGVGNNGTAVSHTPQSVTYPLPTGMIAAVKNYFARRSPVTLPIANSNGNLSYSFVRGRLRFIILDSRTQKRWQIAGGVATLGSTVSGATTITINASPWSGGNQNAPPMKGMELWIAGSPTHAKITSVSPEPVNGDDGLATGVSPPFTCTLDSPVSGTAGDSVTCTTQMLGPTQMTWLLAQLDAAAAAGQFVVIGFPNGWEHAGWQDDWIYSNTVGDDAGTGQRSMVGEHRAISDKILSAGLNGKVIVIGGDNHCTQIDKGSNMDFSTGGGLILPSVRVCPLDANTRAFQTTTDFDHYNECQATAAAGSLTALKTNVACYVDVTDSGGSSIQLDIHPMMASNSTSADYTPIPNAALTLTLPISPPQPFTAAGVTIVQHARFHPPALTTNGWRSYFLNPVTPGNLLIAFFVSNVASMGGSFSVPSGWTLVGTSGSANVFDRTYWKIAGSSESQTPTFGTTPNSAIMHMHVIELASATGWQANPIDATTVDPGSSTTRNTTSVSHTTGTNNLPVIALFAQDGSAMHSDKSGFGFSGLTQIIKSPLPERPQVILGGTVQATAGAATYGYNAPDTVPASPTPNSWVAYANRMMLRTISLKPT